MKKFISENWKKYIFEFVSIFVAVFAAFTLDSWKENRKDRFAESKILSEIYHGLEKDLQDIRINEFGHQIGLRSVSYFQNLMINKPVQADSISQHYFNLFRDFISIQNTSGYETLKSKGLEIIENDSLRSDIITLYEHNYSTLKKLEEEYGELQLHDNYFADFNKVIAHNFTFGEDGRITGIILPLKISENEKKVLMVNLWKIKVNRLFILQEYSDIEKKIRNLQKAINSELEK